MNKEINENPGQHNAPDSQIYKKIKSKSRLIYSSVRVANFIRHDHETNLNLPPPNWFESEGESYGVRYATGDLHDFSSFQIANMFPEYIGKVDIVSNAENIKNLCKIAHDKKSVSIMVHRIDNTLLLDEFDVEKHLILVTYEKWDWLKKFFYNTIVKSTDTKVKCITYKQNDFSSIQHKALVSKFLHHSIAIDSHNDQIKKTIFYNETSPTVSSPVPTMIPEDIFPSDPQKHQLFNRNVLWDFEDLKMLIGTDLPVFENGNNSSLSSRLRDMSKPLSMSTGIDYWLDNLMCDIPETELCYHINGYVQKYELIKTEDLPWLNGSTFSPQNASHSMQNVLSFLKSNANRVGHTYWLFKGKNDNMACLHDLTKFCSESFIDSQNPFTVPVARLLYRVAYELKHNQKDGKPYNPVTTIHLLNNCLKFLDKTKYPEAVKYINYMLSDIYIAVYNNPLSNVIEDLTYLDENSATASHVDAGIASSHFVNGTFSVYLKNDSISHKKENISQMPDYSTTEYIITIIDQCIYKPLYYIRGSLNCLQYFTNDIDTTDELQLRQMLFEKASNVYLNLGRKCFESKNYGISLKCYRRSLKCQLRVTNTHDNNKLGHILEYCGNCFLSFVKFWDKIEQYMSELQADEFYDVEPRETLISNSKDCTNKDLNLILTRLDKSIESALSVAEHCYLRALALEPNIEKKTILNRRIGIVYNEFTEFYMKEIIISIENNIALTPVKFKWLRKKSEHYLTLGSDIFKKIDDKYNFVTVNTNLANIYRHIAACTSKIPVHIKEVIEEENLYLKALNIYMKILSELEDRISNPKLWDMVYNELSSVQYYLSVQKYFALCRDNSNNYRECINSFMRALKYCDLENDTPNTFKFNYQAAFINLCLASLHSVLFEKYIITMKTLKADFYLHKTKVYYDKSFELFYEIKRPLESLEVLGKMIILDMRFIDGICHDQHVKSILKTLGKCDAVFLMFLENKDTMRYSPCTDQIEELVIKGELNFEMKKLHFSKMLKENVCKLLKCMIKMAMTKTSEWLAEKEDELKTIYHLLLRNTVGDNDYSQLMVAVKQLSRFSDD
eukprot:XP_016656217.1 PREDICTED: uncharacterized protein LOC100569960 [Acyrthosiphon pisum]